ncbi:MAG: acetylornithine deacetylase [Rhodospirillaceae bacterium]|nr:acetylornithine deacetylase [Rhodospirillaceae bacterium]
MSESRPDCLPLLEALTAFPTISADSNLPLIAYVQAYLAEHGIEADLIYDETGKKANLYATIGPKDRPGICLSGHTDVVPVAGQDWTTDPFMADRRNGRIHGRGTCDMKGFVAGVLALVPKAAQRTLSTPLHIALSHDEEVGCLGVRNLLAWLGDQPVKPAMCIVGEPTVMTPVIAHKGKIAMRCTVTGVECHSSLAPEGVNAIHYAADLVALIRRMAGRLAADGPFEAGFAPAHTTMQVGTVSGGSALNIVPGQCRFDFEIRHLPSHDPMPLVDEARALAETALLPEMRRIGADAGIAFAELVRYPGLATDERHPVVELAKGLSGANDVGKAAFGTEAGLFQRAGIPTVVCGPGSIAQAHKPDEFIEIDQLHRLETFLDRLLDRVTAS